MEQRDYWRECLSNAAEECGATLTDAQLNAMAADVCLAHENYGMAFYSPPASDRYAEIERKWKGKLAAAERELAEYRQNAETAVKKALRQYSDAVVTIGEHGEVLRHGGRTVQIQ